MIVPNHDNRISVYYVDHAKSQHIRVPVIAWEVEDDSAIPVTANSSVNQSIRKTKRSAPDVVLVANGRVTSLDGKTHYQNLKEAKREAISLRKQEAT
nr:hypothetical protein 7 [bacterium]